MNHIPFITNATKPRTERRVRNKYYVLVRITLARLLLWVRYSPYLVCMNNSLFQALFGCTHRKTTFPLTPVRRGATTALPVGEPRGQTYIACLECGKELLYNWESMRRIKSSPIAGPVQ